MPTDQVLPHPEKKGTINFGIAGAISGVTTRAITQPLDVVKIRFQLQIEPISKGHGESKYNGTWQALNLIKKEEGWSGLWRGHIPAQMLSLMYGIIQFQMYETLKILSSEIYFNNKKYNMESNSFLHFLAGGGAGCIATFCSFPCDIMRTRLVAQGNNKQYKSILHGFSEIYYREGVIAYWRGLTPALIVAAPFIGLQFTFYELTSSIVVHFGRIGTTKDKTTTNAFGNLVSGSVAGIMAKVITYPFDLARKRMQIQSFQYARVGFGRSFFCSGLFGCFFSIYKMEGTLGMFKGLVPSMIKSSMTTALHFTFYAESLKIINKYR